MTSSPPAQLLDNSKTNWRKASFFSFLSVLSENGMRDEEKVERRFAISILAKTKDSKDPMTAPQSASNGNKFMDSKWGSPND